MKVTEPGDSLKPCATAPIVYFPVQMDVGNHTRLLYFREEAYQRAILDLLLYSQGYASQFHQYNLIRQLGDGSSSKVLLVKHRSTGERFAMKLI